MVTKPTAAVKGLRIDESISGVDWKFEPSIGIMAARVDKLGLDIRSFREPLKRVIKQVMAPSFKKNFDEQGRPDAWPPLAEGTLEKRARDGFDSDTILIKTGALMRGIQQQNIWNFNSRGDAISIMDLPNKIWYGKIHQAGYGGFSSRVKKFGGDKRAAFEDLQNELKDNLAGRSSSAKGHAQVAIPQRQFVMIQDEDYDEIERVFRDWLQERIDRTWSKRI